MFWGISLEVGKCYSQTVEKSFHISMAALNSSNTHKGCVTVMVEVDKACYPLCTLQPNKIPQQALDYIFTEGEEVLFYTEGDLDVHLTGYLIDDPNPMEYSTDEDDESDEISNASSCDGEDGEKTKTKKEKPKKEYSDEENMASLISEVNDLNEENEGYSDILLPRSARKRYKSDDTTETGTATATLTEKLLDNDSEDSDNDDDDWQPGVKRKLSKKKHGSEERLKKENKLNDSSSQSENKNVMAESNDSPSKHVLSPSSSKSMKKSSKDKDIKTNGFLEPNGLVDEKFSQDEKARSKESDEKMETQDSEKSQHTRKELPGGTIIEDIVKGQGKKAKKGRLVSVYYKGCLKKSKKQFDAQLDGEPFTFKLGSGEVVKGWDIGIEGMHTGGKRRITVPPAQGYGSKQMGSSIPPNSTLVFIVDLVKVH